MSNPIKKIEKKTNNEQAGLHTAHRNCAIRRRHIPATLRASRLHPRRETFRSQTEQPRSKLDLLRTPQPIKDLAQKVGKSKTMSQVSAPDVKKKESLSALLKGRPEARKGP